MKKITTLLSVMALAIACRAQEKIALNLSQNQVYTHKTTTVTSIQQTVNGQQINVQMNIRGTMSFKVTGITDSAYAMEAKYETLSMDITIPFGTTSFNSEKNDESDMVSVILNKVTQIPFPLKMSRTGRILEAGSIESIFTTVINEFPQLPEEQQQQIKTQLSQSYGEKAMKGSIEMATAVFPDKKVSKGDKWTVNTQLESGLSADIATTYELKEITGTYYLLTGQSVISTPDKDEYTEINGMPMRYDLTGTISSNIKIDKTAGWIVESVISQHITGQAEIKGNDQAPEGMVIPMVIKTEIIIRN